VKKLLITGGLLRDSGFDLGEGRYYGEAILISLDLETGDIKTVVSLSEVSENYPKEYPNLQFTAACIDEDVIWLPTDTEIRKYSLRDFSHLDTYSYSCFQNVHSVAVHNDNLFITSTGLDMVVVLDKITGDLLDQVNAEGKPLWHRFDKYTDYRLTHSTKPHDCHPNFVFWINEEPWVTRCTQEDAVCLLDFERRIDISGPDKVISVHDGIDIGDEIVFTSVDACLVFINKESLLIVETINLMEMPGFGGLRGWCRGLHEEAGIFYLGFSRLRRTKSRSKLNWVNKLAGRGKAHENCSVLGFDLKKRRIVAEFDLPNDVIDTIYTLLPGE